jgi:hypothetical protein
VNIETVDEHTPVILNKKQKRYIYFSFLLNILLFIVAIAALLITETPIQISVVAVIIIVTLGVKSVTSGIEVALLLAVVATAVVIGVEIGTKVAAAAIILYFFTLLSSLENIEKEEYKRAIRNLILSVLLYVIYTIAVVNSLASFITT